MCFVFDSYPDYRQSLPSAGEIRLLRRLTARCQPDLHSTVMHWRSALIFQAPWRRIGTSSNSAGGDWPLARLPEKVHRRPGYVHSGLIVFRHADLPFQQNRINLRNLKTSDSDFEVRIQGEQMLQFNSEDGIVPAGLLSQVVVSNDVCTNLIFGEIFEADGWERSHAEEPACFDSPMTCDNSVVPSGIPQSRDRLRSAKPVYTLHRHQRAISSGRPSPPEEGTLRPAMRLLHISPC